MMTLLIGTRSESHITLSADGMSFLTRNGVRSQAKTDLQKIFPVNGAAIAVVHHGENLLRGTPIEFILPQILRGNIQTVQSAEETLVKSLNGVIQATLTQIPDAERCGFWICGFIGNRILPEIVEIEWIKGNAGITFRRDPAGDMLIGGNGQNLIKQYLKDPIDNQFGWQKLWLENENYHQKFHRKLWTVAIDRQKQNGREEFGGHRHVLTLKPTGCNWTIPPIIEPSMNVGISAASISEQS